MAILDYLGRPVNVGQLTKELAAPAISGVRQSLHASIVNGLTPARLAEILAGVDQGNANDYLTLAEEMEERDLHYATAIRTRKLAVTRLPVMVDAASDDKRDVEIADAVTKFTKTAEFRFMLADLMDAVGKGYSVTEIEWDKSSPKWSLKKLTHRDPRFFQFDRNFGQELRLRDEKDASNGIPLEPFKFIVHYPRLKTGLPIRGGLARLASVAFICKSFSLKDWMTFAEVFGLPLRLGKYDAATASPRQKAELLSAVVSIGTDAAAIVPSDMDIEFINGTPSAGGDKLFEGLADWWDKQVSKGILGQVASMEGTPGKLGSDDAQSEVRSDIRDDDAMKLAATLQRDLVQPFVDLNWGPPKAGYPLLRIEEPKAEDLAKLGSSLAVFIDRGLRVEESWVRDKFGSPEPAPDAPILRPSQSFSGPTTFSPDAPAPATENRASVADVRTALANRVLRGEALTDDQRALLGIAAARTATAATAAKNSPDEIDDLTDEALDDWQPVLDPLVTPLLELAQKAESLEDMLAALKKVNLNSAELTRAVAKLTFKARGLGDVDHK